MKKKISVIIPVYREEKTIQHTLAHLSLIPPMDSKEIIIVDGEPNGNTIQSISQHFDVIKIIGEKGRSTQMNKGAAFASGDILLFLHADTRLPKNAFNSIIVTSMPKRVGAGAFQLGIDAEGACFRLIETTVRIRTHLTQTAYGDQAIFVKRKCFNEIGGYPDIPIMEDVELIRKIKKTGKKISILPASVKTSARRWKTEGVVYCTLRNWLLFLLYSSGVHPSKLARLYPHINQ